MTQIQLRENQKTRSQENAALESKITDLTAKNQQLETQNQQLETRNQQLETEKQQQSYEMAAKIQDMQTQWNELNVSRAQWSVDAYCPKNGTSMSRPH